MLANSQNKPVPFCGGVYGPFDTSGADCLSVLCVFKSPL